MNPLRGVGALLLGTAGMAHAQSTGQINATASISGPAMIVSTLRNLDFGAVVPGVPKVIAPNAASAGEWQVSGGANLFARASFTLPLQLDNTQAPGVIMPISFPSNSALWRRATNNPSGANSFDPNIGDDMRLGPPPNPTLYIWLGGQVNPAPAQTPGTYIGTVVVSLMYL